MGLPHKMFLLESYFRSGRLENRQHVYSINQWIQEFRQQFPNLVTTYTQLVKHIYACVDKFRETGSVNRKPGSGAPRKRAADCIVASNGKLTQKINCGTITRGSVICRNIPHYTKKRSAVMCI
jgi:hypothetical protein